MKESVLRLKDDEAVRPLRRNRFFICDYEELAHRGSFVQGKIYYWSESEDWLASFSELVVLEPEVEAAVLHLMHPLSPLGTASQDRLALLQAANAFTATLRRATDQLDQDLRADAETDLRDYAALSGLYDSLWRPEDLAAKSRLADLWKEALVQAHDLTRMEKKVFGLT